MYALPKLYDRFFSLPREIGGAQSKSTGLGLSFVKEIMKLHNGRVRLENTASGVSACLEWSL
jgi:two-component system sensor histidine kinase CreC